MTTAYDTGMQLEAYLFFDGRCEEALTFYKQVLGGDYDVNRYAGSPMESEVGPEWAQKVMHATFKGDGFTFMASDRPPRNGQAGEANVALSLASDDASEAKTVFDRLAEGGAVMMPFAPTFWGGSFGMLTDRFGQEWMVSGGHGSDAG
jgi:PhnB protein